MFHLDKSFDDLLIFSVLREYLALFKKTVAMHEVFLQRLASNPSFKEDYNFQTFLEYEGDVSSPMTMIVIF